jgi:hypothetical protein
MASEERPPPDLDRVREALREHDERSEDEPADDRPQEDRPAQDEEEEG